MSKNHVVIVCGALVVGFMMLGNIAVAADPKGVFDAVESAVTYQNWLFDQFYINLKIKKVIYKGLLASGYQECSDCKYNTPWYRGGVSKLLLYCFVAQYIKVLQ